MSLRIEHQVVHDADGRAITFTIQRDGRLRKSARWVREAQDRILLRVPPHLPLRQINRLIGDVIEQVGRQQERAASRTDADLQARADLINRRHFGGAIRWTSIRWVANMQRRLGSCTNGGPTDGAIRISERLRDWPDWILDYIIAHELAHRVHPNHSAEFWGFLQDAYPLTERARGFIEGYAYGQAHDASDGPISED